MLLLAALVEGRHQDLRLVHLCSNRVWAQLVCMCEQWSPTSQRLGAGCWWLSSALLLTKKEKSHLEGVKLFGTCKCYPFQLSGKDSFETTDASKTSPCSLWWIHTKLLETRSSFPLGQGVNSIWRAWEQRGLCWRMAAELTLQSQTQMLAHQQPQFITKTRSETYSHQVTIAEF